MRSLFHGCCHPLSIRGMSSPSVTRPFPTGAAI